MTVCIGALCENRKAVVLISDRMWTERGTLYYEFEPDESKIEKIHPHAAINFVTWYIEHVILRSTSFLVRCL